MTDEDQARAWVADCSQLHPVGVAMAQLSISSVTLSSVIRIAGGTSLNREVRQTSDLDIQAGARALHDVIAGTAVIYSWDARTARLRFLSRD